MADLHEGELEMELEDEFHEGELESEDESSLEGEGWLGAIGNIAGSLLGEGEEELEDESAFEMEDESSFESEEELEDESSLEGEGWLGAIGNIAGSLLGEGEEEYEYEAFFESEDEGEQFFGKIGRFLKKLPLKNLVKTALPLVTGAIGGPFGAALGGLATKALGEGEFEYEDEAEGERETVHEIAAHELSHHEALAEIMAEAASHEVHEGEAEAMVGAATITVISPRDRRALRRILPHLVRGTAILTRILRRRKATRPMVRVVPTIIRRTVKDLKKQAGRGIPITRRRAAIAAAKQVRRVLGSPNVCAAAITRNVKVSKAYKRPARRNTRTSTARRRQGALR
ncbi:hypothetical protein [Silvibacterium acidisoli]|uniref:hypothetical protein n=1 Tax=Acidobacteriaceae bacterium ZG23-2 TaxID=2883246 RepID=UPI00406BFE29